MTAFDLARVDVPAAQLAADLKATPEKLQQAAAVELLHEASARSNSPSDRIAYALDEWLVTHPDAPVSTDTDYPGWTPPHTEDKR